MYDKQYSPSYKDSGFNKFFSRSILRNSSNNLQDLSDTAGAKILNFDQYTTSGSLGDTIKIGNGIVLDGPNERIVIKGDGIDVGWIGNIE